MSFFFGLWVTSQKMLTFWQHVLNSIGMWDVKWCEPRCIPLFIIIFPIVWPFFSQKLQDSANFFFTSIFQKQFPIISPMKGPSIFQNTSGKSGHRRGGALFPRGLGPWAGLGCREAWTAWPGIPIGLEVFHGSSFQRPSGYVQIAIENGDL